MKGKVLRFFTQQNQGTILGEDGKQYPFVGTSWQEKAAPKDGDQVDFIFDAAGQAANINYDTSGPSTIRLDQLSAKANQQDATLGNIYASPTSQVTPNYNSAQDALYAEEEKYNMIDWTKKCMSNYVNFKGRARRKEYWYFYLVQVIIALIIGVITAMLGFDSDTADLISSVIGLIFFLPTMAAGARRLHDIGKSGWWQLLWLVLIIGWIPLIIWLATDTKFEHNKWGAPAKPV